MQPVAVRHNLPAKSLAVIAADKDRPLVEVDSLEQFDEGKLQHVGHRRLVVAQRLVHLPGRH